MFPRTNGGSSLCPFYRGKEGKEKDLRYRRVDGYGERAETRRGTTASLPPVLRILAALKAARHSALASVITRHAGPMGTSNHKKWLLGFTDMK